MEQDTLIYRMLKLIGQGIEPKLPELGVSKDEFHAAAEQIKEENLATNVSFSRGGQGNKILIAFMNGSELTDQGERFIKRHENR